MAAAFPLLIGVDLGTTAVKGAAFQADGRIVASSARAYPTHRPGPGAVEQRGEDWCDAVRAVLGELAGAVDAAEVAVVGLTSQANTHLPVDAAGEPLAPALVWQDVRAAPDAAALDAGIGAEERTAWWGAPLPIDASHALARMARARRANPALWARTAHVLLPKDHVLREMTGELATDALSNVGFVGADGSFPEALLARVPGAAGRLPPLAPPDSILGRVRAGWPFAGAPVAVGTMDAWAGMLGCGVADDAEAVYLGGTSEILGIVSPDAVPTFGVLVMPESLGIRLHVGPTQSGGASLAWCARLLGTTPTEAAALAASHDPDAPTPLFLPHLDGERAPLWDAESRGTFVGLAAGTDRAALAYSVLEGVALSAAWLFEALRASSDRRPEVVRAGGGGFRDAAWNRLRADALGTPVERAAPPDPGTLGAALLGAVAIGRHGSVGEARDALARTDRRWEPTPGGVARLAERAALQREAYAATRPINARLAAAAATGVGPVGDAGGDPGAA